MLANCVFSPSAYFISLTVWRHSFSKNTSAPQSMVALKRCNICDFQAETLWTIYMLSTLNMHEASFHDEVEVGPCGLCDFKTFSFFLLSDHIMSVHVTSNLICRVCGFKAKNRKNLFNHRVGHCITSHRNTGTMNHQGTARAVVGSVIGIWKT